MKNLLILTLLVVTACAPTPTKQLAGSLSTDAETARKACSAVPDIQELLARHGHAFGTKEEVAQALPRSFAGTTVGQGKEGAVEFVLDRQGHFSQTTVAGGILSASGRDAEGPWIVGYAGVPVRLRAGEDVELAFASWLQGRDYLNSFDPKRDSAECMSGARGPQISVHYNLPEIGNPELVFGLADAALLSVTHLDVFGHKTVLGLEAWSDPDAVGLRWPLVIRRTEASGSESRITLTENLAGITCPLRSSPDCFGPPPAKLSFSWPKEDPVSVPAAFFLNEVLLKATVGGRAFWGLVDSGATLNVVDSASLLAKKIQPAAPLEGSTQDQHSPFLFGDIPEAVHLGGLEVKHFPVAAVSMPALDEFGASRPETTIGYPIFLGTAVRIDYLRREFLLSQDARNLLSKNAVAIPLKYLGGAVVGEAKIDGVVGQFVLDSGSSETLNLFHDWAEAHGFPGARPTYTTRQQSEVGDHHTDEKRMRPGTFEFGPIHLSEPLVAINSVPAPSEQIAGQIGNGVFAHCTALVFDMKNRTLWLEPPCNLDLAEDLAGWTLQRQDNPAYPDHPWLVKSVIPAGSADLAGIKAGDRILQLAGKRAILDISTFESVTKQSPGTKVPVSLVRGNQQKEVMLNLVRLLSH